MTPGAVTFVPLSSPFASGLLKPSILNLQFVVCRDRRCEQSMGVKV